MSNGKGDLTDVSGLDLDELLGDFTSIETKNADDDEFPAKRSSADEASGFECKSFEGKYVFGMSKNQAPETRQHMRPWLESHINAGKIRGLEWVDMEQKMFKVPWKHVGNREWSEDDGVIFKEWAVHTGRYREGVDHPDWPTWKTRFRCALTKLPDIKELKQLNRLDGNTEEPYRVYQFVPFMPKTDDNLAEITQNDSTSYQEHRVSPLTVRVNTWTLDSYGNDVLERNRNYTPETRQHMRPWLESHINAGNIRGLEWVDMDLKMFKVPWKHVGNREWSEDDGVIFKEWAIHTGRYREGVDNSDWATWKTRFRCALSKLPDIKELKQFNRLDGNTEEPYRVYQFVHNTVDNRGEVTQNAKMSYPNQSATPLAMPVKKRLLDPNDCKLYITIKYLMSSVFENLCANPNGCHILYDKPTFSYKPQEYEQIFDQRDALPIHLPPCNIANSLQQRLTRDLLNATKRGLIVRLKNGSIYATRKCRCRIYISKPTLDEGCEIIRLERDIETLVFEIRGYFRKALKRYIYQKGPKPMDYVVVGFGQQFTMKRESINNLLVSARIEHTEAHGLLTYLQG